MYTPGDDIPERLTDGALAAGLVAGWLILATAAALLRGPAAVPVLALFAGIIAAIYTRTTPWIPVP